MTRITKKEQEKLLEQRREIYTIIEEAARQQFKVINDRDEVWTKRLSAVEKNGVPDDVLSQINQRLSSIEYNQRKLIKATEGLLQFFNMSKTFLEPEPQTFPDKTFN